MSQSRLTDEEIQKLIECIESGTDVPEDLLPKLSPGFFEKLRSAGKFDYKELDKYRIPTIEYAGKRSESVILVQAAITGGAAPLQVLRSFANGKNGDWRNLIVQGDNLQFLKTCYVNQDPLINDKVKGKVKIIFIDPPFGTGDEYGGGSGEMSYSAKTMGAEFLEGLRERLIYLREVLSKNGLIFMRIDYHFGHYLKIIMDEIFGKENFKNELVVNRIKKNVTIKGRRNIPTQTDSIYVYAKTELGTYIDVLKRLSSKKEGYWHAMDSKGFSGPRQAIIEGKTYYPPTGRHFSFTQQQVDEMYKEGRIRISPKSGKPQYWVLPKDQMALDSNWTDIPGYAFSTGYPTENSEKLLERVIACASKREDLILDCFGGSGTTASVAEKLGRRWIVCDFGKHAIYTMQKRIFTIASSNKLGNGEKNKKYGKSPNPFCVVSAGAYDFSKIMNLRENKDVYVSFVLGLFGIIRENTDFSKKYKLPNIYAEKDGDPVEVYPVWDDEYLKEIRIDEEYLQGIISASKGKLKGDYYIITPETCTVIGNTTLKNENKEDVNFHLLKFPYKVLEDVSRQFQIEEQPSSSADINKLISSTGFYFNEEVSIKVKREKDAFKIEHFATKILNSKKELFTGLDGLAMILIDVDYDGKIFDMDEVVYSKDIGEDGLVKVSELSAKTVIIAVDKHGNESKITKI